MAQLQISRTSADQNVHRPPSDHSGRIPLSAPARKTLRAGKRFIAVMQRDLDRLTLNASAAAEAGYDIRIDAELIAAGETVIATVHSILRGIIREERRLCALERAEFNPDQPRIPSGNLGGGEWTSGDWSGGTPRAIPAMARRISENPAAVRQRIAAAALQQVGSKAWLEEVANGRFPIGSNKCNLFVYDMLTEAGANPGLPNGILHGYPPTAGQSADPNYDIPGWTVLEPGEAPMTNDVAAQAIPYSDASGHVMIVGPGHTLVGTGPDGTIEQIPWKDDLTNGRTTPSGPIVVRRWRG